MKLISWNVNGIRAVLKKGFEDFIDREKPDIVCLQETKASQEQVVVPQALAGYTSFWNSAVKKGYSGTAIFTKAQPVAVTFGLGIDEHDQEGRVITAEYADFFLVNVYVPNSKRELTRLPYRQQWDRDFLAHLKKLEADEAGHLVRRSERRAYRTRSRAAEREREAPRVHARGARGF